MASNSIPSTLAALEDVCRELRSMGREHIQDLHQMIASQRSELDQLRVQQAQTLEQLQTREAELAQALAENDAAQHNVAALSAELKTRQHRFEQEIGKARALQQSQAHQMEASSLALTTLERQLTAKSLDLQRLQAELERATEESERGKESARLLERELSETGELLQQARHACDHLSERVSILEQESWIQGNTNQLLRSQLVELQDQLQATFIADRHKQQRLDRGLHELADLQSLVQAAEHARDKAMTRIAELEECVHTDAERLSRLREQCDALQLSRLQALQQEQDLNHALDLARCRLDLLMRQVQELQDQLLHYFQKASSQQSSPFAASPAVVSTASTPEPTPAASGWDAINSNRARLLVAH
jgi:chromosome segregation ATPase